MIIPTTPDIYTVDDFRTVYRNALQKQSEARNVARIYKMVLHPQTTNAAKSSVTKIAQKYPFLHFGSAQEIAKNVFLHLGHCLSSLQSTLKDSYDTHLKISAMMLGDGAYSQMDTPSGEIVPISDKERIPLYQSFLHVARQDLNLSHTIAKMLSDCGLSKDRLSADAPALEAKLAFMSLRDAFVREENRGEIREEDKRKKLSEDMLKQFQIQSSPSPFQQSANCYTLIQHCENKATLANRVTEMLIVLPLIPHVGEMIRRDALPKSNILLIAESPLIAARLDEQLASYNI